MPRVRVSHFMVYILLNPDEHTMKREMYRDVQTQSGENGMQILTTYVVAWAFADLALFRLKVALSSNSLCK